ncbi:MAG: MaoC family dehydratase [Microbacterium sp.]|uniref:MaoC family dehydratase n=1 Tax=Microbacterium sp. TaxID=51671 RepID=UPI002614EF28|nr:MaoC family dehydratase [Microbacterium sp.]MCX6502937.1 MaoC family dehydratase [Microbacterium sp.]
MRIISLDDLDAMKGQELGVSTWYEVDQRRVDAFAVATEDEQWIHTDPERATAGMYGGTIAHGYLILSLLPRLTNDAYRITGVGTRVNYGLDRVRFPAPLRTGSRVRLRAELVSGEQMAAGLRIAVRNTVQIEQRERPACVAETLTLLLPESSAERENA